MAGFRMGRGRDSEEGNAARQARHPGQQGPYGGAPYGAPGGAAGHTPGAPGGWHGQQWQGGQGAQGGQGGQGGPAAGRDEPEYFGGEPSSPPGPPQGPGPSYGGQQTYGGPAYGGHGGQGGQPYPGHGHGQGQGQGHGPGQPYPQGAHGGRPDPSYDPYGPASPHPGPGGPGQGGHPGGHPGNRQGSTQQFGLGEAPDAYPHQGGGTPYGDGPYGGGSHGDGYGDDGYGDDGYDDPPPYNGPPPGPKLHWKELLTGLVLRPSATFWRMRDHPMWVPALLVTFVYGLLAVFGFDKAREDVLNATFANSIPLVLIAGVIVLVSGLILGAVTHTLARQLGGDGLWQPTIGLSLLIMSITDAPRLVLAVFLGGDNPVVQLLGWATWLLAGYLFTSMVSKSHDIPWPKALGASAIQLAALLSIIKLGTL
ncbi:Yip1 family protein [Streptomyces sp. URMC 126]|uniref:Yip1 family protein n=1 Tax=Streptomyces sp. URMC 126 TaxID=3423401 RepID=UPI003F1BD530